MILVVDNYDSFTWNLVHYVMELGVPVEVHRNDALSVDEAMALGADGILLSPGPCTPDEAGISLGLVAACEKAGVPLLGVCLGHQAIGQHFGGRVVRGGLMHGKTSPIYHSGVGIFRDLPSPYIATRYHSLVVYPETLPDSLEVSAWTDDIGEIRFDTSEAWKGGHFHFRSERRKLIHLRTIASARSSISYGLAL